MTIRVRYWSWFKDLVGVDGEAYELAAGASLGMLMERVRQRHPRLEDVRRSTLVAVGVEYRGEDHPLVAGDEVSLFPPVQGG